MARLTEQAKRAIIQRLACYESADDIIKAVKEEFGASVSKQALQAYDPDKVNGQSMSEEHVKLFRDTRKRYREETEDIPISSKAHRLRVLNRLCEKAESKGNAVLTASLLEQAAKECGGMYDGRGRKDEGDETPVPSRVTVEVVDARKRDAQA